MACDSGISIDSTWVMQASEESGEVAEAQLDDASNLQVTEEWPALEASQSKAQQKTSRYSNSPVSCSSVTAQVFEQHCDANVP